MVDAEHDLIKAIAAGNQESFERLVTRYQNPLCNFIYRHLGDRGRAEDLTQQVFLQVYRSASRFNSSESVSSWIFKIAFNLAFNENRRIRRMRLVETPLDNEREYGDGASAAAVDKLEMEQQVMRLLKQLPDRQRATLLLRVNEGLSYREIGEALDLSIQSVESLIFRARQQLRRSMRNKQKQ